METWNEVRTVDTKTCTHDDNESRLLPQHEIITTSPFWPTRVRKIHPTQCFLFLTPLCHSPICSLYFLNLSSCSSVSWICVCFLSLSITRMSIIKLENTGAQAASTLLNNQVLAPYWLAWLLSRLPLLHILGLWLQIMQLCVYTCSAMAWPSSVTQM